MIRFVSSVLVFLLSFVFSFAQSNYVPSEDPNSCPNFTFTRNLAQGSSGEDVRLLQKILNLDKRTIVSTSGVGMPGAESPTFGIKTREALKRFQALFIEYVDVADGKLNAKTREVLNNVCKGPFFTGGSGGVYDIGDKIPPQVGLAGPRFFNVQVPFRAYVGANEGIKTPSLSALIISGGVASDIRRVSSSTYNFLVTPNSDVRDYITLQFEADSLEDMAGNTNPTATNEWVSVKTLGSTTEATTTIDLPVIDLPTIDVGSTTDCSTVVSVNINDYNNPCYGRSPFDYSGQGTGDTGGQDSSSMILNILTGLLQGLLGKVGGLGSSTGGPYSGGTGQAPGTCVCTPNTVPAGTLTGQPTIGLLPKGGTAAGGRYLMTANPGAGDYTGNVMIGLTGVCGQRIQYQPKGPPICVNPTADNTGVPVVGSIPPAPAFRWGF